MKKKIIIPIIILLILVIGFTSFIILNNRIVSTITMDINPSIAINLDKYDKVINIKALNEDAKDIISNEYKHKTLDETFELLITNIIDKGYSDDNNVGIVLYADGLVSKEEVATKVEFIFGKKDIHTEIVLIEEITKEDQALAKKYNITPAKAAYIKTITSDNENIIIDKLVNKSVNELNETKVTGKYCDDGLILSGDWCLKEINRVSASIGEVCPKDYLEYEGTCYHETRSLEGDNYTCQEEFKLENDKCTREMTEVAIPTKYSCNSGTAKTRVEAGLTDEGNGDANDIICVDMTNATHPMSPCEVNDGTEYTMAGGKCYWHRAPVIAEGCPGKIQVNGECWDDASNILICVGARDGKRYTSRSEFCEGSIKYTNPIVTEYKCENKNASLNGNKCIIKEIEDAPKERYCEEGYTLVDNDKCINYNKTISKENGLVCEGDNTKLKGNTCIIYELTNAKEY